MLYSCGNWFAATKKKDGEAKEGLLAGFAPDDTMTGKEELQKMVEHIQGTLGAETVRLKKMKTDHQQLVRDWPLNLEASLWIILI